MSRPLVDTRFLFRPLTRSIVALERQLTPADWLRPTLAGRWVVRDHSRELIELVLGLPLSASELLSVLTGCPVITGDLKIKRFDDATGKIVASSSDATIEVFIRRDSLASPWETFAMTGSVPGRPIRWRADPGERTHGVLESVRLTSLEWSTKTGRRFDLSVSFDRVQTPALGAGADLAELARGPADPARRGRSYGALDVAHAIEG